MELADVAHADDAKPDFVHKGCSFIWRSLKVFLLLAGYPSLNLKLTAIA
jgi:hypothetical protein